MKKTLPAFHLRITKPRVVAVGLGETLSRTSLSALKSR